MKRLIIIALIAGLAGGLAEIAWIAAYSSTTSASGVDVARQVAATVLSSSAETAWAPWAGAFIHLALSLGIGLVFVLTLWGVIVRRPTATQIWGSALVALACIWALNFCLILPAVNPGFVTLLPYAATLLSKVLFGVAMASVLQAASRRS